VHDEEGWDIGLGAGFYVDATRRPGRPLSHVELRHRRAAGLVAAEFPALDMERQAITGHSMGGHGALTVALRQPGRFRSVSAFAPIVAPSQVPWGEKAFTAYLGPDRAAWRRHDAVALIEDGARAARAAGRCRHRRPFPGARASPELLEHACAAAGQPLTLRRQAGYDHSYHFISTFMPDHLAWHAQRLAQQR
jgi:S-formylglutathione hydrolase